MTIASRKTAREALATAITSNVTAVQTVYDHVPNDFDTSPVATVSSWSAWPQYDLNYVTNEIELMVSFWVLRLNVEAGQDYSGDAEDELDTLTNQFATFMQSWDKGEISRPSETDYAIIKGKQYRVETHFVRIADYES